MPCVPNARPPGPVAETARTDEGRGPRAATLSSDRSRLALAAWALLLALPVVKPIPVAAQEIRGTVLEVEGRQPVAGASVTLVDDGGARLLRVVTDSAGSFSLPLPRAGDFAFRVEMLGYATLDTDAFHVDGREILELRIFIGVEAVELPPVEVTARGSAGPGLHPDFDRRLAWGRKSGLGRFFTREDIEDTSFLRTSSLLMQVQSIRLVHVGDAVLLASSERGTYNCRPVVYMNGMEMPQNIDLDRLMLNELEGVEVYPSRHEVPTELARGGDVCSAVAFWTRAGQNERGWSWGRILAGGVIASGIAYFGFLR